MPNAIFHMGSYYLLPDDLPTFEAFLADLHSRTLPATYRLLRLKEENRITASGKVAPGFCLAPCFLTGYKDWYADVPICDAGDVFPVQVERIPLKEYDLRLREVIQHTCEGCVICKPPTARAQSLQPYRERLSLNGTCFFRWEEKPLPRVFGEGLGWLGGGFMRLKYAQKDAEELRQHLKEHTRILCESAEKVELPDGSGQLNVTLKKKELLPPYLMLAVGHYIHGLTDSFRIAAPTPDVTSEALLALVAQGETFRAECKKYGAALAFLTWNGQDGGRVAAFLEEQEKHLFLHTLCLEDGCASLLLLDLPLAMSTLRFHAPMLEAFGTQIAVHGQSFSRRYAVSFDMPYEPLD